MQGNAQGYENYGYLASFQASRREDLLKAGMNWQVNSKFSFGLNSRYAKDDYDDSALGVQNGKSSSTNLSADYAASANASYGAYLSSQRRSRDLLAASDRNLTASPLNLWSNTLNDRDNAIGIYGKQKLFHDKFQLSEDLSYGLSKSTYFTAFVQGTPTAAAGSYGPVPDISSKLIQFRLTGSYQIDKSSSVSVGYMYQRLITSDYYYYAYQLGFTPTTLMPSNQQAPHYTANTVFVTYRHNF
jgi:hypothetical protein